MIFTIDLGTSYLKFALFDRSGRMTRSAIVAPSIERPHPGWMEMTFDGFLKAVDDGVNEVFADAEVGPEAVEAITFATQANTFLLLDSAGRPLTPLLSWTDVRARDQSGQVRRLERLPRFVETTGVPAMTAEFMAAKLQWLMRHNQGAWRQAACVCTISELFTLWMTGHHAADAGSAALTGLLNATTREWWLEALETVPVPRAMLAEVFDAGTDLGPLLPTARERWGFGPACRFVVGCLDQYAGGIGVGNTATGILSETTGTVLAALCCTHQISRLDNAAVFHGPSFREGLFYRMTYGGASADFLHWYRGQLAGLPSYAELASLAASSSPGAEGIRLDRRTTPEQAILPYLNMSPASVTRAILEANAFALRDHVAALGSNEQQRFSEVRSAGGAARSATWLQIKADVLGVPVRATECPEPTSLGAAILAEATLSRTPVEEVAREWVRLKPAHEPDPQRHGLYSGLE
jgi:xylulokinase